MHDMQILAEKLGVRPSTDSGQHFLVDEKVLERIIATATVKKKENILEIGPGFGVLTRALIKKGATVCAVEFDRKLASHLASEFGESALLRVIQGDILSFSNREIAEWFKGEPYRVVSNIPYHITGKIIKKFVSSELPKPTGLVLLVQKEVAERVCALPGDLSLLGLSVQLYADPSIAFGVPREAFWPEPRVESAVLAIRTVSELPHGGVDEKRFWQLSRIGFSNPRKQLRNNLASGFNISAEAARAALKRSKLSETARAQELSIPDWIRLINALAEN